MERIKNWIIKTEQEQKEIQEKEENAAKQWYAQRGKSYLSKRERRKLPEDQQPPRYLGLTFQDLGYRKLLQKRLQLLNRQYDRFKPYVYSVYNGPDRISRSQRAQFVPNHPEGPVPETFILTGGSVYARADQVDPGILSIVNTLGAEQESLQDHQITEQMDGRRLAFAKWLTDEENPLFARTMVNRIWQYHFGKGLSATPNNFGATGDKPSHPELLDWLATYFIQHDYSIKKLHKLIMTSEAYQMSSEHLEMEKISLIDPDNRLLFYYNPRRLEAEEIRDAMLSISGELNPTLGGFPVRPEINQEVAMQPRHTMGSIAPAYQPSRTPRERNRRTIYAETYRTLIDPDMEVFNKPGSDLSCEHRHESTVTPQVFTQFNGKNVRTRALALAHSISNQELSDEENIQIAIQHVLNREAEDKEVQQAKLFLNKMTDYHQEHQPIVNTYPTTVHREMFEEMTGVSFSYEEELDIYQNYVPDIQATDVAPATRALADFVAVLFNSNEFLYVY